MTMRSVFSMTAKNRRTALFVFCAVLLGGVVIWAASDLLGAANSKAQQSAVASTETQVAAFDSLPSAESQQSKPNPPQGDWATINKNEPRIKELDKEYLALAESAKSAKETQGAIPGDAVAKLKALTDEYVSLQDQNAVAWEGMKPVCKTRAKTSRDLAAARKASNDVLCAEEMDKKKLGEMKEAESALATSHTEYTKSEEAKDVAPAEKTRIKQNVIPGIDASLKKVAGLISEVTGLIKEAQSVATGVADAKSSPLGALNAVKKGGGILDDLKNLLGIVQGTEKNMKTVKKNAETLAK